MNSFLKADHLYWEPIRRRKGADWKGYGLNYKMLSSSDLLQLQARKIKLYKGACQKKIIKVQEYVSSILRPQEENGTKYVACCVRSI